MKRALFAAFVLAALALGLAAGNAPAQPCPPGFHMQPGAGCVRNAPPPQAQLVVTAGSLRVRQCPTVQCRPVGLLHRGAPVRILAAEGPWVRIVAPRTGLEGWVLRRYISY